MYPHAVTEVEHNIHLAEQVDLHFMIAVPIYYILSFLFVMFFLNKVKVIYKKLKNRKS